MEDFTELIYTTCNTCSGKGYHDMTIIDFVIKDVKCAQCNGSGRVPKEIAREYYKFLFNDYKVLERSISAPALIKYKSLNEPLNDNKYSKTNWIINDSEERARSKSLSHIDNNPYYNPNINESKDSDSNSDSDSDSGLNSNVGTKTGTKIKSRNSLKRRLLKKLFKNKINSALKVK